MADSDCWNIERLADLAEVIPFVVYSQNECQRRNSIPHPDCVPFSTDLPETQDRVLGKAMVGIAVPVAVMLLRKVSRNTERMQVIQHPNQFTFPLHECHIYGMSHGTEPKRQS